MVYSKPSILGYPPNIGTPKKTGMLFQSPRDATLPVQHVLDLSKLEFVETLLRWANLVGLYSGCACRLRNMFLGNNYLYIKRNTDQLKWFCLQMRSTQLWKMMLTDVTNRSMVIFDGTSSTNMWHKTKHHRYIYIYIYIMWILCVSDLRKWWLNTGINRGNIAI